MQPSMEVYKYFSDYIYEYTGIHYPEQNYYQLDSRLSSLLKFLEIDSFDELMSQFKNGKTELMHQMLIDTATNNETYFYRDPKVFDTIEKEIMPLWKDQASIDVWSAASSTGQEIYSFVMMLQDAFPDYWKKSVNLMATDISSKVLDICRKAQYTQLEVQRGLPIFKLSKHFTATDDNMWQFNKELASKVKFSDFNLFNGFYPVNKYDLIFCRNMLIYQPKENKQMILSKMEQALKPGGIIVLGATENTIGMDLGLKNLSFDRVTFYQKPGLTKEDKKAS